VIATFFKKYSEEEEVPTTAEAKQKKMVVAKCVQPFQF
jgi:hypothetical protein